MPVNSLINRDVSLIAGVLERESESPYPLPLSARGEAFNLSPFRRDVCRKGRHKGIEAGQVGHFAIRGHHRIYSKSYSKGSSMTPCLDVAVERRASEPGLADRLGERQAP